LAREAPSGPPESRPEDEEDSASERADDVEREATDQDPIVNRESGVQHVVRGEHVQLVQGSRRRSRLRSR
jgi:hypothetical protein